MKMVQSDTLRLAEKLWECIDCLSLGIRCYSLSQSRLLGFVCHRTTSNNPFQNDLKTSENKH